MKLTGLGARAILDFRFWIALTYNLLPFAFEEPQVQRAGPALHSLPSVFPSPQPHSSADCLLDFRPVNQLDRALHQFFQSHPLGRHVLPKMQPNDAQLLALK